MIHPLIKSIEWLGEDEALLIVSDGRHTCKVFAYPFQGRAYDSVKEPLLCFEVFRLVRTEAGQPNLRSVAGFEHEVIGRVVRVSKPLVQVGEFLILPDCPLPRDILEGQMVILHTRRLDYLG